MTLTTLNEPPAVDAFTPLEEHQSQTPTTFYDGKPVKHFSATSVLAQTSPEHISKLPFYSNEAVEGLVASSTVDVWVTSESLIIFQHSLSKGVSIPYPTISLHAIQRIDDPSNAGQQTQSLYMQLELSDPYGADDEDPDIVELTLVVGDKIQDLFDAVSNCSNLHPDQTQEDEDMEDADGDSRIIFEGSVGYEGISGLPGVSQGAADGGLPPPFPGSGGWITAENVSEYFDEDGNWIRDGGESLGEGAGRTRTRDEVDGADVNGVHESDDNKRPRTD